jgi:hypothetical protein
MQMPPWMARPESNPLLAVLQIAAFAFRHATLNVVSQSSTANYLR